MPKDIETIKNNAAIAQFRFAIIAPVVQGLYPDASATAYYKRVTQNPPVSALSFPLCVPHPPANCVNITHFHLIYQGVLQRIFGMLSVKIGLFFTMLRCFCLLSRHFCTQICSEKLLDGGV